VFVGVLFGYFVGIVCGIVVDDEDFGVSGVGDEGIERTLHTIRVIVDWNDDGDR